MNIIRQNKIRDQSATIFIFIVIIAAMRFHRVRRPAYP